MTMKEYEGSKADEEKDKEELSKINSKKHKSGKKCKTCGKTACKHRKGGLKLNPPSKGHAPKGAHGRAAVHALGRTKTTGNFKKIEAAKGKGAAIAAYQNALHAHQHGKRKMGGKEMLGRAMKKLNKHK